MIPANSSSLLLTTSAEAAEGPGTWDTVGQFGMTFSNGDRTLSEGAAGTFAGAFSTTKHSTGKKYFEVSFTYGNGNDLLWGIATATSNMATSQLNVGQHLMRSAGDLYSDGGSTYFSIAHSGNTRYGVAVDLDAKRIWFMDPFNMPNYINSGNPAGGINPTGTMTAGGAYGICARSLTIQSNNVWNAFFNSGQFLYTPPAGFSAWG